MESQWTTIGKRTSNKVAPAPRTLPPKEAAYIESVRTNAVYSNRQFSEGLTAHRITEPVYAKGSVFSSRLRNEVEQARTIPLVVTEIRNTTEFEATKPISYKNAAVKGLEKEKARIANATINSANIAENRFSEHFPTVPLRPSFLRPKTASIEEEPTSYDDEGFDDSDAVVRIRRKRVQPTEKFQSISRVTTIHKSAIDIIEPEESVIIVSSHPQDDEDYV